MPIGHTSYSWNNNNLTKAPIGHTKYSYGVIDNQPIKKLQFNYTMIGLKTMVLKQFNISVKLLNG